MNFQQSSTHNGVLHLTIHKQQTHAHRRLLRFLTLFFCCMLFAGIPASAARMGSVDINGSEVAYQAQYKAYTEAASGDDAAICKFTVGNPNAGKNGALCRIILPQSQNVYLYMDAGDLAVMRYDGSEYKKFSVDYQLKSNFTYTLCVFRDGLVLFDGTRCYTYSGNFYGFTDILAGWSAESNVFSTSLTRQTPTAETTVDTEEEPDTPTEASLSAAAETVPAADPYPPIWFILALVLGVSSNLLALASLRSSNMALRAVRRTMAPPKRPRPAAQQPRPNPAKKTAQAKRPPQKKQPVRSAPPRQSAQPRQPAQQRQPVQQQQPAQQPMPQPVQQTAPPPQKRKPTIFFPPEEKPAVAKQPAQPEQPAQPVLPYDLYTGTFWKTYATQFQPYCFGDPARGYCTFVRGSSPESDLFVLSGGEFMWLNPVRFHATSPEHGVRIRPAESVGISMAFDFCHVETGKRELALTRDVEMVNFQPAQVEKSSHGAYELVKRGIIVFEKLR